MVRNPLTPEQIKAGRLPTPAFGTVACLVTAASGCHRLALNVADPIASGDYGEVSFDSVGPLLLRTVSLS